jgi:adenine phosphoribosyltransferase
VELRRLVRDVPDFPKEGILFRDITPLLAQADAFHAAVERMTTPFRDARISKVLGIESRGFMFGAPLALRLGAGFVPVRKPGRLPSSKVSREYALEYGHATLEMHRDALRPGDRVLVADDVIATGGTLEAAVALARELGAEVAGCAVLIELVALKGRARLPGIRLETLLRY